MTSNCKPHPRSLLFEALEDRRLLAAWDGEATAAVDLWYGPADSAGALLSGLGEQIATGSILADPTLQASQNAPIGNLVIVPSLVATATASLTSAGDSAPHQHSFGAADTEDELADIPASVTGAFLTWQPSDLAPISFDDVIQGRSDTCAFTAVLSAVARSDFDLTSGIVPHDPLPNGDIPFSVRIHVRNAQQQYQPLWVDVISNGLIYPEDLQTVDRTEFWPALYLRAYLQHQNEVNGNYANMQQSFESLTGRSTESFVPHGDPRADALYLRSALTSGRPMTAGTIDDEPLMLESQYGLIHDHAYTVLGVEVPSSGSSHIYVTLRNPWGKDTIWTYFDADQSGNLSISEGTLSQQGIDGNNDGIIRIPWSTFSTYFDHLAISNLTGPSINTPQPIFQPVFTQSSIGPFTIREGETLGPLALTAVNPNGEALFYSLRGNSPGYVQLQSGQYVWEAPAEASGSYRVTVVAETDPFHSAAISFVVHVESGSPSIGWITVTPDTITDSGTDVITIVAEGVSHPFDDVDFVHFWRDADGDALLDRSIDTWLGRDENGADGWSWTGTVGGVTPGDIDVFAQAGRYAFSDLHLSLWVRFAVDVDPAPYIAPVAIRNGSPLTIASTGAPTHVPKKVVADAAGNVRAFFWKAPENKIYSRLVSAEGVVLNVTQLSPIVDSYWKPYDVAMAPDGSFAVAYLQSSSGGYDLKVTWYSATGSYQQQKTIASISVTNPYVQVASDHQGNLLITYQTGSYSLEEVYAVSVARDGSIARAPWRVNAVAADYAKWPTAALNADGNGIVAWLQAGGTYVRFVTGFGTSAGPAFMISAAGGRFDQPASVLLSAAVNTQGESAVGVWRAVADGGPFGQRFDASGQPRGASFATPGAAIALNDLGWLLATGELEADPDGSYGVFSQLYQRDGAAVGPRITVPTATFGPQSFGGAVIDGDADIAVAWGDGSGRKVYLQRFSVNLPPEFDAAEELSVAENSPPGTLVGTLSASDPDNGDVLQYSLVGDSPFVVDSVTGEVRVGPTAGLLNYEQIPQHPITVEVFDDQNPRLGQLKTRLVSVLDVNEPPQLQGGVFSIPEHSPVGTVAGVLSGFDPEGQPLRFSLVGSSPFQVDPTTGVLSVANPTLLDANLFPQFQLTAAVADAGVPPLGTTGLVVVDLTPDEGFVASEPPAMIRLALRLRYGVAEELLAVAPTAGIVDSDSVDFTNGLLRFEITNATTADEFLLDATSGVVLSGADVRIDGSVTGTLLRSGAAGTPWEIVFNANATLSRVEALLRSVRYRSSAAAAAWRDISLTLNDGHGGETTAQIAVGPPPTGDFDGNGVTDSADLPLWSADFGVTGAGPSPADADNDQDVDGADFLVWQRTFGFNFPVTTAQVVAGAHAASPPDVAVASVNDLPRTEVTEIMSASGFRLGASAGIRLSDTNARLDGSMVSTLIQSGRAISLSDTVFNASLMRPQVEALQQNLPSRSINAPLEVRQTLLTRNDGWGAEIAAKIAWEPPPKGNFARQVDALMEEADLVWRAVAVTDSIDPHASRGT